VAEGPVLDELMNNGGIPVRPATMPERLLGTPAPAP